MFERTLLIARSTHAHMPDAHVVSRLDSSKRIAPQARETVG